jgi:glycosyltransferase involved in cell wall biosynthesis
MRICIDATSLLLRSAGVKNYTYHWMRSLQAEAPQLDITAFPLLGDVGELDHERSVLGPAQTWSRIAILQFINKIWGGAIDWAAGRVDVFHASNLVHAVPKGAKLTGTLYDMTTVLMPEVHTAGNVRAERNFHNRVLKRAGGVIAISESAKSDAVRLLGLDPDKIAVIYPGIDGRFFTAQAVPREKPYVLSAGTIEPRKNVDTLLDAWETLPADLRAAYDLVIAGPQGWNAERTVARIDSGIKGVRRAGYVPERDLPALFAGATAFVYPSLYEGFGFPPAQAMAAGVPVITSRVSSLPEVVGDAGVLIEPRDPTALRDALERMLTSETLRKELGKKGKERARRFSWKNSALRSAEFFQRL